MALSETWGWGGWVVVMLLPLSFWALLAGILVLVFRGEPVQEVDATIEEPVLEPARQRSALGWLAPVVPHH